MPLPKHMMDEIQTFFGKAGLDVQSGSTIIKGKKPPGIQSTTGKDGTTIKVGDVLQQRNHGNKKWSDPVLITEIFNDGDSPELAVVRVDDWDRHTVCWMPWRLWGPDYGKGGYCDWYREHRILDQAAVDKWWHKNRTLKPGWHKLQGNRHFRVHIAKDGAPDIIERGWAASTCPMDEARKMAEVLTGYDLTIERVYIDNDKKQRKVKTAKRRKPPKIG